ncbi:MAG TPA: polymer-forming cytoskeletal protein [Rhodocyclaceae bacterium]|jgi:cytoskeletal protein CcmA (bactofilin family)|nr:polymer-forming cytoskeletal protein [Rhodocyclaceae bacterium]
MFGNKSSATASKPQNRIDTLIGVGTQIQGDIAFSGGLRIDGEVHGNVIATGEGASTLVISEHARVEGVVRVSHVVINGNVTGPVHSSEFLELQPKARVTGDVEYNTLEMHLGAVVQGRLVHDTPTRAVELKLAANGAVA